ncbi:MAG TPA: flagellar brake domain-containing protein [Bacillota bacterium]|nr:flagellar brake domain-containing protein [Bacillota bacterium]
MEIGKTLHLELYNQVKHMTEKYRSQVVEMHDDYLFIDYPINERTNKATYLHTGTPLKVNYIGQDGSVYSFQTTVTTRTKRTVPVLVIDFPKEDKIKRIQRREYVRIQTAVDVAVHFEKACKEPFTTVTKDISGGGLSIFIPDSNHLAQGDLLNVWIVLPMQSGSYHYVEAKTEVIRTKLSEHAVPTASIKFISITNTHREKIIRYCFEKQWEARQKELM